ncbi:histone deacetylase, putative [Perkinsus marinus ATCC 50983]|uniref:Histone deacetylase, putative n=1 Tax=Perkinsus marinus (strain ATCC 50983 / TXsc) TaxID=423536 RepID=C5KDG7_PERM5|nr:histone deacetylase, putative [Perkinsus marinus ATCC 50983]EER17478.1 histone deacetylase, putative [Perkinsus marinus ATCC 50983]|eukprot:XP_002785682.1 histone deacetylase, putative [Perkinsus marinus ATCC 50983]
MTGDIIAGSQAKIHSLEHPRNTWLNGRLGLVEEVQEDGFVVFTLKELHPHRGSLPEAEPQRIRLHSRNLEPFAGPQTELAMEGDLEIHQGCKARITGLVKHSGFNGVECIVDKWHMDKERWIVRLQGSPDKRVLVRERNLQLVDGLKNEDKVASEVLKPQFWKDAVPDPSDPRSLIGRYVKRTFSGTPVYGKILRWYGPRLGFFIRYEDGESEHCSVSAVRRIIIRSQTPDISLQDRRLADRKIGEYPSSPSSSSSSESGEGHSSTARKRRLRSPPIARPKVLRKLSTTERVPRAGQWVDRDDLPAKSVYDLVSDGPIDRPLLLYNPLFIKHNGGAQDKHGRWVRSIKRVLQTRKRYIVPDCKESLWDSCAWADSVSSPVTIPDVLVTNIHSKRYLHDLVSIDNYLQQQVELKDKPLEEIADSELPVVDLCSKRCARLVGRALTLWPGECCMDPYTLKAALLRCGMMRDALVAVLSGSVPTAFVLARPACHHVPYRVKSEDIHIEDDMPELNVVVESPAIKFMNSPQNKGARTAEGVSIAGICEGCREQADNDYMLNCDREGCSKSWHVYCLPDPLPKSILKRPEFMSRNWYCPACLEAPGLIKPQEADEMRAFVASLVENSVDESVIPGMNLASSELDDDAVDSDIAQSDMSENAPLMGSAMNIKPGDEVIHTRRRYSRDLPLRSCLWASVSSTPLHTPLRWRKRRRSTRAVELNLRY